jgi:hypothetical protein
VTKALVPRVREDVTRLGARRLGWVDFTAAVADVLRPLIAFDAYCWHTVDPGTILFTGTMNRNVGCSGSWLAHHEYVVEDVNKWSFLAHSGRIAGATSIDTHGDRGNGRRPLGVVVRRPYDPVDDGPYGGCGRGLGQPGRPRCRRSPCWPGDILARLSGSI